MPQLVALHKRKADKGLVVVGLHVQNATDDEITEVSKKLKIKFPVTKGGNGGPIKVSGIPHSAVFDATGKLVFEGHPADKDFDKAVDKALKTVTAAAGSSSGLGPKPGTTPSTKPAAAAVLIPERAWTNSDGKKMMAALVSVEGDNARFKKKDGSTFTYPLSKLVEEDQTTIKEAAAPKEDSSDEEK
jgi:hypothetical protein